MKIIVISDTHSYHNHIEMDDADCCIHCGDFGSHKQSSFFDFISWYSSLDYKYKILIAGNHDIFVSNSETEYIKEYCFQNGIIYLENDFCEVQGIKIWGSPYSNTFYDWAFMEDEKELEKIWEKIPQDTNIVITHGPAYSILDKVDNNYYDEPNVGSKTLLSKLENLSSNKLKYHFCGHIHEGSGIYEGKWITCNAAILNERYELKNKPYIFEYKI